MHLVKYYFGTRLPLARLYMSLYCTVLCLQCFDAVGWAAGRASGLYKTEWWGAVVVICLEWGADLHTVQLMPLPLTVSCFSKIQIGFNSLVLACPGRPGQRAVKRVCVCVCCMVLCVLGVWLCGFHVGDFAETHRSDGRRRHHHRHCWQPARLSLEAAVKNFTGSGLINAYLRSFPPATLLFLYLSPRLLPSIHRCLQP